VLFSTRLERALRYAALCHDGQKRRGEPVPYVEHVAGVAMVLDRLGFGEDVVIAGLLHDVVEDSEATLDEVRARFGPVVAGLVGYSSEVKTDALGVKRPWADRKRDHLAALAVAPPEARAVALADKLHNLVSIAYDLAAGLEVWPQFHAARPDVLNYYRTAVETLGRGEPRLERLAEECRRALEDVEALGGAAENLPQAAGAGAPTDLKVSSKDR
jgi:hypothetical protein